jgi:prepilin-type N-terminal cleavage/methylation domain-containing protein
MQRAKAFTLVELLVVVVVLAIIAAIVIPQFSNASQAARSSMLRDNLRTMRTQIQIFKAQHCDVPPGYPTLDTTAAPTEADTVSHLTRASTAAGDLADPGTAGYPFGPYFREIPENPINGRATIQVVADGGAFPVAADDSHGYVYQPSTGKLRADATGTDEGGKAYFDY